MSYDLVFCVPEERQPLKERDFRRYFERRAHYKRSRNQAWYENDDTGVYFSFDFYNRFPDQEWRAPEGMRSANVSFNMNLLRPHVFALEAHPEVAGFVREFGLSVDDPQGSMRDNVYSNEAFLAGWNGGNRLGLLSLLKEPEIQGMAIHAAPTSDIELVWRWNYNKNLLEEMVARLDVFTPTAGFVRAGNTVQAAVVWGDGVAIALPPVPYLVLGRQKFSISEQVEWCLIRTQEAAPILALGEDVETHAVAYKLLDWHQPPAAVAEFFRSCRAIDGKPEFVAFDEIRNAEFL